MKKLEESFRLNVLPYTLLKRNEYVALYGIGGEFTDKILHYEVDIIYMRTDKYGTREHIAKNDDFGRARSRCYIDKATAFTYFDKISRKLMAGRNLSQGVPKVIAGVQENVEVIPEYPLV